jgi:hypothetical protein
MAQELIQGQIFICVAGQLKWPTCQLKTLKFSSGSTERGGWVSIRVGEPRGKPFRGARRVPRRAAEHFSWDSAAWVLKMVKIEFQNRIQFVQICSYSPNFIQILSENKIIDDFCTELLKNDRKTWLISTFWVNFVISVHWFLLSLRHAVRAAWRTAPRHAAAEICRFTLHWFQDDFFLIFWGF